MTKHRKPKKRYIYIGVTFLLLIAYPLYLICLGYLYKREIVLGLTTPAKYKEAHLEIYGNIPVLHVYGTPEEIGTQYGELLKRPLLGAVGGIRLFINRKYLNHLLKTADILGKNLPEHYRTELKAISKVTGISYNELVAMNVTPDLLMCSCLAVWGKATKDGKMLMGRNLDYEISHLSEIVGLITVYHFKDGNSVVSVNFLGMIGCFTGMNSEGVVFGNMLVYNARERKVNKDGISIQLLLRDAAQETNTARKFADYLVDHKHVIPMNVMVADKTSAFMTELDINESKIRSSDKTSLAASNYFRDSALQVRKVDCPRYSSLVGSVKQNYGKYDVATMENALYRARINNLNLQAVVFEPEKMLMHVAMNSRKAAAGPYITFDVRKLLNDEKDPIVDSKPKDIKNAALIKNMYKPD
jgi:predicted choloylglycine hydrolase